MANTNSIDLESGSSQFLSRASSASLRIKGDLTIEMWLKMESLPSSGNRFWLMDKKSESGEDFSVYSLQITNNAGTYQLALRTTNGSSGSFIDKSVNWSPSPSTGVWVHVAVTRASTGGTIKFYVDGSQMGADQTGYNGTLHDDADLGFYIGRYKSGDGRFYDGLMDDIRVWNVVRTQAEISNNRSAELTGGESGLQGYWKLNNALTDSTANGNTLTNNGSAVFSTDVPFTGASVTTDPIPTSIGGGVAIGGSMNL